VASPEPDVGGKQTVRPRSWQVHLNLQGKRCGNRLTFPFFGKQRV
jgi:hypothetical protein